MTWHDIKQAGSERRQYPRLDVENMAEIIVADSDQKMSCLVIDWAMGGARLRPHDPDSCPNLFTLITREGREYSCQVVWRRDGELGVKFPRADRIIEVADAVGAVRATRELPSTSTSPGHGGQPQVRRVGYALINPDPNFSSKWRAGSG